MTWFVAAVIVAIFLLVTAAVIPTPFCEALNDHLSSRAILRASLRSKRVTTDFTDGTDEEEGEKRFWSSSDLAFL